MTLRNRNLVLLLTGSALLTACNPFKKDKIETPTVGERVAVLVNEIELQIDPETAAMPMVLPEAVANEEWAQSGG
ncbi:MAG TPA: hypothetical protein VM468_12150, partial [Mycoplana sp.]|nr:hypothetical protein [Mycoplana sp.]